MSLVFRQICNDSRFAIAVSQQTTLPLDDKTRAPNSTHAALLLPASGAWVKDLKNYTFVCGPASKLAPATLSAKA
jgi:hypothetical protein